MHAGASPRPATPKHDPHVGAAAVALTRCPALALTPHRHRRAQTRAGEDLAVAFAFMLERAREGAGDALEAPRARAGARAG